MSVLAIYRTAIIALLDDPYYSRFTATQVDAALRFALIEYSIFRPPVLSYNIDGAGTYRITMPADFQPLRIIRAELHAEFANPQSEVKMISRFLDNQWEIETTERLINLGESLDLFYMGSVHTIYDLDGADVTTIPVQDEQMVQIGAAGYACISRATSQGEANVIQSDATKHIFEIGNKYLDDFRKMLRPVGKGYYGSLPSVPTDTF